MTHLKARAAEWILSQVLSPDRARSTVGDWMEDATERGHIWFWSCVFRTVCAQIRRALAESPAMMARVGLDGFCLSLIVPMGFGFAISFLRHGDIKYNYGQFWNVIFIHTNQQHGPHWDVRWQIDLAVSVVWIACVFQTGRWIARLVPERETAGCVAVVLAGWIVMFATQRMLILSPLMLTAGIIHCIALFAGALAARGKSHGQANACPASRMG